MKRAVWEIEQNNAGDAQAAERSGLPLAACQDIRRRLFLQALGLDGVDLDA